MTVAQARVADCVARGLTYPAIAAELAIAIPTVRVHVMAIVTHCLPDDFRPDQRAYVRLLLWFQATQAESVPAVAARGD